MKVFVTATVLALLGVLGLGDGRGAAQGGDRLITLSGPSPFPVGCDHQAAIGTLYQNAEVQPHVAVDPLNPRHVVAVYQQDRWSGVAAHGVIASTSYDAGYHWYNAAVPVSRCAGGDYWRATDTQVSISPDGTAYAIALSMNTAVAQGEHAIQVSRSLDGGWHWQVPTTLAHEGTDPNQFVFNDLPAVTADPVDSRYVYAAWDRIVDPPLGGPLYFARSTDHGTTWQAARPVVDPGAAAVVEGAKIVVTPDRSLVAFFAVAVFDPVTEAELSASYQVARSTDRGATWSAPVKIADVTATGTKLADGTDLRDGARVEGQLAVGPDGTLRAVWQDSRFAGGAHDGIVLSSSTDGGANWSAPVPVAGTAAAPAFTPAVAVGTDGGIGVSYSTLTGNSALNWIARSSDGGLTWQAQQLGGPFDLTAAPVVQSPPGSRYLGDYRGMAASGRGFVSVFAVPNSGQTDNRTDIVVSLSGVR